MNRIFPLIGITLLLAACADHPPLAEASGPYRPLNAGHWTPPPDDLTGPRTPLTPARSPALTAEHGS